MKVLLVLNQSFVQLQPLREWITFKKESRRHSRKAPFFEITKTFLFPWFVFQPDGSVGIQERWLLEERPEQAWTRPPKEDRLQTRVDEFVEFETSFHMTKISNKCVVGRLCEHLIQRNAVGRRIRITPKFVCSTWSIATTEIKIS